MKLSDLRKLAQQLPQPAQPMTPAQQADFLREMGWEVGSLYQELEMESPFVDTHRDVSYAHTPFKLHSHHFYELLYCRSSGSAEYLVGTDRYRLQKDDVVLVAPGVSHCPLLPEHMTEPYIRDVVWISPEFMQKLAHDFPALFSSQSGLALLRTAGTKWEKLGDLFQAGITLARLDAPEREMALVGNTITLLAQLYRASLSLKARQTGAEKPELLEQVMAYISANLQQKLTLDAVARHFYVSQSTISQVFRNKTGVSFHRCVNQLRLIAAKERIAEGIPLEAVAERVGFTDYSSFYRAFKQEYGMSPRQYRNRLK